MWIPFLVFETLLCALALIRGYQSYDPDERDLRLGGHSSRLLTILIRDSAIYYVLYVTYLQHAENILSIRDIY